MAVVLLALVAYLFLVEFPQERKKQDAELQAKTVFLLNEDDINYIQIKYPDQTFQLQKESGGRWKIISPIAAKADPQTIKSLVSTITDMRSNKILGEEQNLSGHGFDKPSIEITLNTQNQEETIIIGDEGPITNTLYVKRNSDQKAFLTDQWIKGSLTKTLFDLRNKTILSMEWDSVTELKLNFQENIFSIAKEGENWLIKQPITSPADISRINNLILSLSNLRAIGFIDDQKERDRIKNTFGKAYLIAILREKEKTHSVSFYQTKETESIFAVTASEKPLYKISKTIMNDLKSDLFHYQDKRLVMIDPNHIEKISIEAASESYSLQLKNRSWFIDRDGEGEEADNEEVKRFIHNLKSVQAQEKPDASVTLKTAGLDTPSTHVRIFDSENTMLGELILGTEVNLMLYAKGAPHLGITLISKNILDDIPRIGEIIRSQQSNSLTTD